MRCRTKKSLLIVVGVIVARVAMAGMGYQIVCKNNECGKTYHPSFGGGFRFEQITAYCVKCDRFVAIRWDREKEEKPQTVGRIWNSVTGELMDLYACPDCKAPVLPIVSADDIRHCPACAGQDIDKKAVVAID